VETCSLGFLNGLSYYAVANMTALLLLFSIFKIHVLHIALPNNNNMAVLVIDAIVRIATTR